MSRRLLILHAGRREKPIWGQLCGEYRRRIERWVEVDDVRVRVGSGGAARERAEAEARALEERLPEPCWTVALDRRGRALSSRELAGWLGKRIDGWAHPIAFLIGSDVGLAPRLVESARTRLSFGPLTLPHELARLVLYEQLYRALCIRSGIKYHREPLSP